MRVTTNVAAFRTVSCYSQETECLRENLGEKPGKVSFSRIMRVCSPEQTYRWVSEPWRGKESPGYRFSFFYYYLIIYFWYWGLNSGLHAC
jgi:hypothetical protein